MEALKLLLAIEFHFTYQIHTKYAAHIVLRKALIFLNVRLRLLQCSQRLV
jgi:hypothetical protein